METIETLTGRILKTLETAVSPQPAPTSKKCTGSSYSDKMKFADEQFKRNWINKRLGLDHHHPDLAKLEDGVWDFCRGFAMNPKHGNGKRLVIFGNNGVSKSRCARAIAKWVREKAIDLPLVPGYLPGDENMSTVSCELINWAEQVGRFKEGNWDIDALINIPMLILDDIGAEHDPSKAAQEKLYLILDRRERRWTVVTTNVVLSHWESRFERRVADRLFRNSTIIDLSRVPSYSQRT